MGRMNIGRIVLGGLAAGVVANIFDAISGMFFLKADSEAALARLNLDPNAMNTFAGMLPWIVVDFVYGLLIVTTYAAIRPRFSPGPMTALYAGFLLYAAVTMVMYGMMSMGVFSSALFVKSTMAAAITTAAASLVGAAIYKE